MVIYANKADSYVYFPPQNHKACVFQLSFFHKLASSVFVQLCDNAKVTPCFLHLEKQTLPNRRYISTCISPTVPRCHSLNDYNDRKVTSMRLPLLSSGCCTYKGAFHPVDLILNKKL